MAYQSGRGHSFRPVGVSLPLSFEEKQKPSFNWLESRMDSITRELKALREATLFSREEDFPTLPPTGAGPIQLRGPKTLYTSSGLAFTFNSSIPPPPLIINRLPAAAISSIPPRPTADRPPTSFNSSIPPRRTTGMQPTHNRNQSTANILRPSTLRPIPLTANFQRQASTGSRPPNAPQSPNNLQLLTTTIFRFL